MFNKSKLFFWTAQLVLTAGLIFLLMQIKWIFNPITTLFGVIFIPFIIAGFLYYVFDPIINFLQKKIKMPRVLGIIGALLIVIGGYVFVFMTIIPSIISQMTSLITTSVKIYPQVRDWVLELAKSDRFRQISKQVNLNSILSHVASSYQAILENLLKGLSTSLTNVIGTIVAIALVLFLVPILLYYLLKDAHRILPFVKENILTTDRYNVTGLLKDMNRTISKYIFGLAMDALFVFVMAFIGYMIIGIPYAFLFALFAAVMNLVPYIGPYIGVVPVILTVAFNHPWQALIAVVYVLIVQQIDGNVVYPRIVGSAVHVHPVTVMLLMMVSGGLYGLLGMVIAVPTYALIKEIVKFAVTLYRNIKSEKNKKISDI